MRRVERQATVALAFALLAMVMVFMITLAGTFCVDTAHADTMPATPTNWLLDATLHFVPAPVLPPWGESPATYTARRAAIARDAYAVANDPTEMPLFAGTNARERTALFMLAIASYESGYDLRVDSGLKLGGLGEVCLMQILVMGKTAEGWTRTDLLTDRTKCFRAALHALHGSAKTCKPLGYVGADLYSVYASGHCMASKAMRLRYARAVGWYTAHPWSAP